MTSTVAALATSMSPHLQLHWARRRVHFWIVVLVDTGLESTGADGVFGTQAILQGYGLLRRQRVEVEDRLRGGEAEFLQTARFVAGGLFLERLQVFAEQVEAGRNTKIDHDHVRGLGEVVANRNGRGDDIVLGKLRAIVDDVDGEGFGGGLSLPTE